MNTPATLPKRWLTIREVAAYLSLKEGTIKNFISRGRLPYAKRRGVVRFDLKQIDKWLEDAANKARVE